MNPCRATLLPPSLAAALLAATPALARDNLGMFGQWAAFRDAQPPRCYAIAAAEPSKLQRDFQPYADVAIWLKPGVRGQVHFRVSRKLAPGKPIDLAIGAAHFALTGGGSDAWAADPRGDAAIVAAMRSGSAMTLSAHGADGHTFSNTWPLTGAGTAIDAAQIGCAKTG